MEIDIIVRNGSERKIEKVSVDPTNVIAIERIPIKLLTSNGSFRKFGFSYYFRTNDNVTHNFFSLSGKDSNYARLLATFKSIHGKNVLCKKSVEHTMKNNSERKAVGYSWSLK